jgi:Amino acid synthesis
MTATFDIRKIVTLRDVTYSELGHKPARPIVRAVGMAVIHNAYAGKYAEDLRQLWEAVAAASGAASVRVWHITSRGWDPWTERPLPEVVRVAYPPTPRD